MRIAIVADGGPSVGLGHLSRCLALAQALREHGARAVFLTSDPDCRAWVRRQGFASAPWKDEAWDAMISDSYRLSAADLARLRRQAGVWLALDDLGRPPKGADLVLNGSAGASTLGYPRSRRFLLGPRYSPLRREYWRPARKRVKARIENLLITSGGGDVPEASLLARVRSILPEAILHVVVGPFAKAALRDATLHRAPATLKPLMELCDAAVSAGGHTLYELAALGTPTVGVILAGNQAPNVRALARKGLLLSAGSALRRGLGERVAAALAKLEPASARRRMSAAQRRLVDGQGARRVAARLIAGR